MQASDLGSLTVKQRRVYNLLADGKTPPEIAKAMKISRSGVYGHMRQMRRHGIEPPEHPSNGRVSTDSTPDLMGALTIPEEDTAREALDHARASVGARLSSIDERLRGMQEEVNALRSEHDALTQKDQHYEQALAALA